MATTYTLKSNSYNGRVLTLTCTQTPNLANNTSTINWTLTVSGGTANYYTTGPTTVKINGTEVYFKARTAYTAEVFPAAKGSTSGSITVSHNNDGSKSIPVSLSTAIYTSTVNTASGTWTLDSIGRASTASCSSGYIGDWASCTISAASTSYTHKVGFTCLGVETLIGDDLRGGTHQWGIPETYYDAFGSRESAVATGYCETYSGNTLIGSTTFTFTIYADTSDASAPILTVDAYDDNSDTVDLTGDEYTIIKGYSDIYYTISARAQNGATIESIKVVNGSSTKTASSGRFSGATSGIVTFYATDSRGKTARETVSLDVIDYIPLTCNLTHTNMSAVGDMTITVSGNYFDDDFGDVDNTLTVQYRYKEGSGSYGSWTTMSKTISGNTYTASKSFSGLNPDIVYTFQARATDELETVRSDGTGIQSKPIFDWSATDFNFNVPVNFSAGATGLESGGGSGNITGDLSVSGNAAITGNLTLKGSGNYGNSLYFGDGSYAYIAEAADDALTIHADEIILDGDVSVSGGALMAGTWTPKLYSSAVDSYTVQEGWYQIVGDCATVGFLISASIDSGYSSRVIEISGFPFDLHYRAFGGGVAYGPYAVDGVVFNSWAMSEGGIITGRLTSPNATSTGNLTTNSGLFYPSGGGDITLSGTITCRVLVE